MSEETPLILGSDTMRELLDAAASVLERLQAERATGPAHRPTPDDLIAEMLLAPDEAPGEPADVLGRFEHAAGFGWDKSSPGDLSFIPNGGIESGVVAWLLAAGTHAFTGQASESPALVALEESVIRWMARVVGLPAGSGGVLLSGGSLATLDAIVAARGRLGPAAPEGTIYVAANAHHSVAKGARLAGIADDRVRSVPLDRGRRLDPRALEAAIAADRDHGLRPFLVVATAGTTDTGTVDDLVTIACVARAAGCWFHVDAAYGGFFALTERGGRRLAGLGDADSVTVDAHKGLFLPYGVGALLVRDRAALVEANEGRGAYMAAVPSVEGLPHYYELGPELTRPFRGLAVWLPLHLHGVAAFRSTLDRMLDLATRTAAALDEVSGVEVVGRPDLSVVAVRARSGDAATRRLIETLNGSGRFEVSGTTLDGRLALRLAFLSPRTSGLEADAVVRLIARTIAG